MLARVLAIARCLSVTSRCSIKMDGRIELVFGTEASFDLSYSLLLRNSCIWAYTKIRVLHLELFSKLRTQKFRHGILIVEMCYQPSSRKADAQSVINWTVVGQLS